MCVDALRYGPGRDDVVHDSLAQRLGHVVQLHELSHAVENLVISPGRRVHLLEDRRHVSEDGGVEQC